MRTLLRLALETRSIVDQCLEAFSKDKCSLSNLDSLQLADGEKAVKRYAADADSRTGLIGDLSDLPEEVLAELSLTKIDELEQQLRDIVAAGNGAEVGLDAVIIELYRRHKVVQPRRFIMNKLYRMAQKGLIEGVEGRKGVYVVPVQRRPMPPVFDTDLDDDVPF